MHKILITLASLAMLAACSDEFWEKQRYYAYSSIAPNRLSSDSLVPLYPPTLSKIEHCFEEFLPEAPAAETEYNADNQTALLYECLRRADRFFSHGYSFDFPTIPHQLELITPLPPQ